MGFPNVNIKEGTRCSLAKASTILNGICLLLYLSALFTGIFLQREVKRSANLIEGFNAQLLPIFIISVGFIGAFFSALGIRVCWSNHTPKYREKWGSYLFIFFIVVAVLFVFVFISAIMCFASMVSLKNALSVGIYSSMQRYQSTPAKKTEIDALQIKYQCCGSKSYTDWFHLSWIHDDYLNQAKREYAQKSGEVYLNDDVPFSCCDATHLRPCVHHHVHDNNLHYNYDFRSGVTLYKIGCTDALMAYFGKRVLLNIGLVLITLTILELFLMITTRLLQTSISTALKANDVEGTSIGFLFPCGGGPKQQDQKTEEDKPLLEQSADQTGETPNDENIDDEFDDFDEFDDTEEHIYANIHTEQPPDYNANYGEYRTPHRPIYENNGRVHYAMLPAERKPGYNDYNVSAISSKGSRRNAIPLRFPAPPSRTYFKPQRRQKTQ